MGSRVHQNGKPARKSVRRPARTQGASADSIIARKNMLLREAKLEPHIAVLNHICLHSLSKDERNTAEFLKRLLGITPLTTINSAEVLVTWHRNHSIGCSWAN